MLFAQSDLTSRFWPFTNSILAGAALLFVAVLAVVLLFLHSRSSRQLLNTERMRSLEAGFPYDTAEATKMQARQLHNAFWISFWLAFAVPAVAFSAAYATTSTVENNTALSLVTWIGASAASVAAVVCAAVVMACSRSRNVDV